LATDDFFMREALKEAHKSFEKDEVPVGAVVVANNRVIARAHNLTETLNDVTAHAEMQAITAAASYLRFESDLNANSTILQMDAADGNILNNVRCVMP